MAELEEKMSEEKEPRIAKKVLFVKNLPYDTKDDEFEKAFSDIGPIRKSFLVREKDGTRKCKGFGYVTFAIEEDAQRAKDTVKTLQGRSLKITFSEKKPRTNRPDKSSKKQQDKTCDQDHDDDDDDGDLNNNQEKLTEKKKKPKSERSQPETDAGRTVLVFGLPASISSKELYKRCRKVGKIEKTVFPVEGRDEPVAALTYSTPKLARTAVQKLNNKTIKSKKVTALLKSKEHSKSVEKSSKKSRLIVRNLSFKCTEGLLREVFSQCGEKVEVHVPMDINHKRNKGFAFVQFSDVFTAAKAMKEMNLKVVLGRPIAVDWAVSKGQYDLMQKSNEESAAHTDDIVKDEEENNSEDSDEDKEKDDKEKEDEQQEGFEKDESEEDGEEESDDDSDGNSESNVDDTDEENIDIQKSMKKPSDVKEGLTLFIRNVNYDTTEKSLYKLFKKYGDVSYCKIVTDPVTDHSKGTAFVKFKTSESVDQCLADSSIDSAVFVLDGHKLQVDKAVTRGKASQLRQEGKDTKKEPKDKRNLYLSREGVINAGSEAAKGLTKADLLKRQKAEAEKKTKLQNPNCFVSTTRLCVRNLPLTLTELELKKVFGTAGSEASKKPAIVKKVMIMRSKDRFDSTGKGRSLGFAFIEFTNHKDALTALRSTNNNPEVFGPNRRPIVEFSIENSLALKARQQRLQRSKFKQGQTQDGEGKAKTHKEQRQEKAMRRREKRKQQRNKKSTENQEKASKNIIVQQSKQEKGKKEKNTAKSKGPNSKKNNLYDTPKSSFDSTKKGNLSKPIISKIQEKPVIDPVAKRSNKRKAKDIKEEKKFNSIVQKYKNKLFGEKGSSAKRARWYE